MKKLIIILLFVPFVLNAQVKRTLQLSGGESFAFEKDKQWHTFVGGVSGLAVFWPVYLKTRNENFAFRISLYVSVIESASWEAVNSFVYGKPFSIPDMLYTDVAAFITAFGSRSLIKGIKKVKAKKIKKKFDVSFLPNLKDEPLIKN